MDRELTETTKSWRIDATKHPSRVDPSGCIVEIRGFEGASAIDRKLSRPRVLAIANQKGGVGKTTTAINLGTALAAVGEEVLIVDLDPQGNASTGLGVSRQGMRWSTYHVLIGETDLKSIIVESGIPRLHCAPSTMDLLGAELELADFDRKTHRLHDAIGQLAALGQVYGYVLLDCPPSLNLLTINALSAADAVLVPLQCEFFALEGLSQLLKTVELVRQSQFAPRDPGGGADHVRPAELAVGAGGAGCAQRAWREGL